MTLHCTSHHKQFCFTDNSQHPPAQAHRSQTWRCRRESEFHLHDEDVPHHEEDVHFHDEDVPLHDEDVPFHEEEVPLHDEELRMLIFMRLTFILIFKLTI